MGKKGGEWKGYLARVGGGSSSWLVALRLGHWCGTAGVQEGHTAPGIRVNITSMHLEGVHIQAFFVKVLKWHICCQSSWGDILQKWFSS